MADEPRYRLVWSWRQFLASGIYDCCEEEYAALAASRMAAWRVLDAVPRGQGKPYQDNGGNLLADCLDGIVDKRRTRKERRTSGRRIDLEMPIRTERLANYPLWDIWADRYHIRSILAEFKNLTKDRATPDHVGQLGDYLRSRKRGRLGILVSRTGFTRKAMQALHGMAEDGDYLILPFDHDDMFRLVTATTHGAESAMEFFGGKERDLLQVA